jgi:hypothetical protein
LSDNTNSLIAQLATRTKTFLANSGLTQKELARLLKTDKANCNRFIISVSNEGCAIVHNYVANSDSGLVLGNHDCYQGNVVTNCKTAFKGGHAVGGENGSD